jgi:hypothetical protein
MSSERTLVLMMLGRLPLLRVFYRAFIVCGTPRNLRSSIRTARFVLVNPKRVDVIPEDDGVFAGGQGLFSLELEGSLPISLDSD